MDRKYQITKSNIIIIPIIISLILLCGCNITPPVSSDGIQKSGVFFDTYVTITLYGLPDKEASPILDECMNKCLFYENLFSSDVITSDIYKLNNSNTQPVNVSPETISLINKAYSYSEQTDGLFDITIFSATKLWDFHADNPVIPSEKEISAALEHIDYHNMIINTAESAITLSDASTQIDIGGIAKGYIADQIGEYIKTTNASGAIINIGGDMLLIGTKPNNLPYTVGINDPFGNPTPIKAVSLTAKAIATSGTYIRTITDNNKAYHHILDPSTGYPAQTDLVSATIITDNAIDADTLCTISILLGSKDAVSYINTIPNTEAILITGTGEIILSDGASTYIK